MKLSCLYEATVSSGDFTAFYDTIHRIFLDTLARKWMTPRHGYAEPVIEFREGGDGTEDDPYILDVKMGRGVTRRATTGPPIISPTRTYHEAFEVVTPIKHKMTRAELFQQADEFADSPVMWALGKLSKRHFPTLGKYFALGSESPQSERFRVRSKSGDLDGTFSLTLNGVKKFVEGLTLNIRKRLK
jgi:hypothetical protein